MEMRITRKVEDLTALIYSQGLEDGFIYHIPMFGTCTKLQCIDSGFTPDWEKDKIPFIIINGEMHVPHAGDFIVYTNDKIMAIHSPKDAKRLYDIIEGADFDSKKCTRDRNGNIIYSINTDGYEKWMDYDKDKNMIHIKDSNGYEEYNEYINHNLVYTACNDYEEYNSYNSEGFKVYSRYIYYSGFERRRHYDQKGIFLYETTNAELNLTRIDKFLLSIKNWFVKL